jgi:hypothetical protein
MSSKGKTQKARAAGEVLIITARVAKIDPGLWSGQHLGERSCFTLRPMLPRQESAAKFAKAIPVRELDGITRRVPATLRHNVSTEPAYDVRHSAFVPT